MSKTAKVASPNGSRLIPVSKVHPARYSDNHIQLFADVLNMEYRPEHRPLRVIDPMCGVGSIHRLMDCCYQVETYGNEIEQPYVDIAKQIYPNNKTFQGDAKNLEHVSDGEFDAVIVSPDFGSRFADSHNATDLCKCMKSVINSHEPLTLTQKFKLIEANIEMVMKCDVCYGTGFSMRRGYVHDLRRYTSNRDYELDPESSARNYAWQLEYWRKQIAYWIEAFRILRSGGLFMLDVKNFIKSNKVVDVVGQHRQLVLLAGFEIERELRLEARGLRHGANYKARVDHHVIIISRKP